MADAGQNIRRQVSIPAGYWIARGGTVEPLESIAKLRHVVAPVSFLLFFMLLFAMLNNVLDGLLVLVGVPLALTSARLC